MELSSLYDFYERKFRTTDDNQLRKRIMAFPESNLADLTDKTLVQPNPFKGLKVVEFHRIDGFTHTTAENTVAVPNGYSPITIARYHEEDKDKLLHPALPLLAVRIGPLVGGELDYEYYPLERVYYRETRKEFGGDVWTSEGWSSSEEEDETGLEEAPLRFGHRLVTSNVQGPSPHVKKEEPVKLDFPVVKEGDWKKPTNDQSSTSGAITKQAPSGRGMFMGRGGTRPPIPRK